MLVQNHIPDMIHVYPYVHVSTTHHAQNNIIACVYYLHLLLCFHNNKSIVSSYYWNSSQSGAPTNPHRLRQYVLLSYVLYLPVYHTIQSSYFWYSALFAKRTNVRIRVNCRLSVSRKTGWSVLYKRYYAPPIVVKALRSQFVLNPASARLTVEINLVLHTFTHVGLCA